MKNRLTIHGPNNVVVLGLDEYGELTIELYGDAVGDRQAAVILTEDETKQVRRFLNTKTKVKKAARP